MDRLNREHRDHAQRIRLVCAIAACSAIGRLATAPASGQETPMDRWLQPQAWHRHSDGPVIALGKPGAFDDTHIFAPCVAHENGRFRLWYCGSRGTVGQRVFNLGLATSRDGVRFERHPANPVLTFGDGKHSILTPALLRRADGSLLRDRGKLRMWFASTHFAGKNPRHSLHETTSTDGIHWSPPSPPQMNNVYAPTILEENDRYRMWYVDVTKEPWILRHAASADGRRWIVRPEPIMLIDQTWESGRLFYPYVLKAEGLYLMWYGSYWSAHPQKTAIGFAVSRDGLTWRKHPANPVLRPEPSRPWESHYTTSHSVLRLDDGAWRIWYAVRKAPPFENKYFAICTARWSGPK
ncbi:MAG: hypothetical protein JXQ73_27900 [Phycisphaerae bacterium]|nr:hypothetical protein [Phycisphaerae bacterium]